jgi:chromosome segregation ATPase
MSEEIADRLAALESKMDAKAAEAAELNRRLNTPPEVRKGASRNQEAQHRQDAALHERRRLREEWAQAYDEQLVRVAPKVEQLEAKRRELEAKRADVRRRQAAELTKLEADVQKVCREIDQLTAPPPMPADPPSPDAVEMVLVDAGANWGGQMYIRKDVADAQEGRRQQARSANRRNP